MSEGEATAEYRLLGCMLLNDEVADQALGAMQTEHFVSPAHRVLFAAIREQREKGFSVDVGPLLVRLRDMRRLEDCGGEEYLCFAAESVGSPASWAHFADIVRDQWAMRQFVEAGKLAHRREVPAGDLRLRLERVLQGLALSAPPRSGSLGSFAGRGRKTGVATGFALIDKATICRGLPDGQMSVVMATTGGGKTAWSAQVAHHIAAAGHRVCYATFADMDAYDVAERIVKNLCGHAGEPRAGTPEHRDWCAAVATVKELDFEVYDATEMRKGRDVETFAEWFRGRHAARPFRALVMDYAQELTSREPKARSLLDQAEAVAHTIRWLAAETGVPILVGSQMTEGNAKAGTQDMTKGSRIWQERAALVLKLSVLSEEERLKQKDGFGHLEGLTRAELLKNRFGKRGQWVWWQWMGSHARFEERS